MDPNNLPNINPEDFKKALEGFAMMTKNLKKEKNTNKGYYNEISALAAKELIDKLHAPENNGKPLLITNKTITPASVALRFWQGQDYLLDNLDPTKKYAGLKMRHSFKKGRFACELKMRISQDVEQLETGRDWKIQLEEFISTSAPLDKRVWRYEFDDDDLAYIENYLNQLTDFFVYDLKSGSLMVIRKGMK